MMQRTANFAHHRELSQRNRTGKRLWRQCPVVYTIDRPSVIVNHLKYKREKKLKKKDETNVANEIRATAAVAGGVAV